VITARGEFFDCGSHEATALIRAAFFGRETAIAATAGSTPGRLGREGMSNHVLPDYRQRWSLVSVHGQKSHNTF
jgi:hypothetical protein